MVDEKLLILRFKRGSREALRQIYDRYKVDLLKLAVVLAGDVNTAEDVVHDVFVKFAGSAATLEPAGSLRSYLSTSVVNRIRNRVRDSQRRDATSLDDAERLACPARGPQQWAVLNEQLTRLSRALAQLPYEQREVICLRMEMDTPVAQIAALQHTSVNTVKGRYRYGMERLRSLLDSEVEECNPQMT
ncbi:MAG: sigma-70 family RNA polymerase sigma factor [Sedimentisphaerales bacterium]|nr:sigma-70 family RNA polymerase sigma factor [Sedimentisphaerales bacterium]